MARKKTVKHHKKKIQTRKNIFILIFSVFVVGIFLFSRLNQPHGNVLAIQMMPAQQVTPTATPTTSTPTPTPTSTVTAAPTPTSTLPSSGGALQFITPTPTPSLRELPPQPVISATGQPLPSVITTTPTPTPSAPTAPILGYGFYEGCDPYLGQQCLDRLSQMASSGFKLVLNYGQLSGSAQDITNYLNTANSLGMKVIFAMSNHILWDGTNLFTYYTGLAKTCKTASGATCTTNKDLLTYMVTLVKNNPGLWGYYVGDELEQYYTKEQNFFATWSGYSNFIHSLDPNHPRLVIEGTRTNSYANPYIATFAPYTEVIGQDYYPIGDSSVVPYTQTGAVAKSVQSLVNSTNRKSAFALQLFSEQEYYPPARCTPWPSCAPLPTKAQLQKMVYDTLSNSNPQFILFYSYFDLWDSRKYSMIANDFETQQQHWDDLVSVVKATIPAGLPGGKTTPNSLFKGITDFLTGSTPTQQQTTQMPSALSVILSPLQSLSSFIFALFGGR